MRRADLTAPALTDALDVPLAPDTERPAWARLNRRAVLGIVATTLVLLAWSVSAPLSGAVIAHGYVKAELNRKTVQHQEGGIVREILVRDGQVVKAGDPLLVIGDVRIDALLDLQQDQRVAESIRQARLTAELGFASDVDMPAGIHATPAAMDYLVRERALFAARRKSMVEQVISLEQQIVATEGQIRALGSQIAATRRGLALANEELAANRDLVGEGFVQRTRIMALERAVADYEARANEQAGDLSLAQQRLGDLRLRMVQARNQYQQQAAVELKEVTIRLREIEEQLRPTHDAAARQYVRSPVDGAVMDLRVASVGVAVGPREPLLAVVPTRERLVVEARVAVEDIEHVRTGGAAEVRLTAYEYRAMPMMAAQVLSVTADRLEDQRTGLSWFTAQFEVDAKDLAEYPDARMQAGMPAEVFVATRPRTLFAYVMRPLMAFASRGMREP